MRRLLAAVLLLLAPGLAHAKEYTAQKFDSRIEVLEGGSLRVTETIVVRFKDGSFTYFFRTVPTRRTDGVDFISASMDGQVFPAGEDAGQVEVRRQNGLRVEWHFSPISPSTHTFEVTYVAKGVARTTADRDVVGWRALPSEHAYRIETSRVEMALPSNPADPPAIEVRRVDTWTATHTDARVLVNANGIGKNGWVEVWARMPKGSVITAPPEWQQRQLRQLEYRTPSLIAAGMIMFAGIVLLFGIRQSYDSPPRGAHTGRTFNGPPDSVPPAIAGALITNGRSQLEHAMGTLFALASHGALAIHEEPRGPFGQRRFTVARGRVSRPLAPHEEALMTEVFSAKGASDGHVPLDKARTHLVRHFSKFKTIVEREMTDAGLFDAGRRQVRARYKVIGAGLIVLALLALIPALLLGLGGWPFLIPSAVAVVAIMSFMFAAAHTPLSNEGVRRAEEWRAYQKQLREMPKEVTRADWAARMRSPAELLPLAVALGLAGAWSKIFKDRAAQLPPWFHAASASDANTGFVAFVGHGGAGTGGGAGGGGGGAAGGGGSGAG